MSFLTAARHDRYLEPAEDYGIECSHEVECERCGAEETEVSHHVDSEAVTWQCFTCGHYNVKDGISIAPCIEPDPDYYHDNRDLFD